MRVVIYDSKPGAGIQQWFLMLSWAIGSRLQKLFGAVDEYYGASSWTEAALWLQTRNTSSFSSIQYWGHGSPGTVWLNSKPIPKNIFDVVLSKLQPQSVIWFRTCSTFQNAQGQRFSENLANSLNCIIAGHTRIVGLLQGGLHTRMPHTAASWPIEEGEPKTVLPSWLYWGNNTITCLQTKIPKNW
jgi:hypothetical protein